MTTVAYDANGNLTHVQDPSGVTMLLYDKENRLRRHENSGTVMTHTYDGGGLKRAEVDEAA